MKFFLKDIKKYKIKNIYDKKSIITVFSKKEVSQFKFKRIFFVRNGKTGVRGNHAHKKCYQFMFSLKGKIKLVCDDGLKKKKIKLEPDKNGIMVPPTIWTKQEYLTKNSILGVICDRNYEEEDYIRNYIEFKKIYKL